MQKKDIMSETEKLWWERNDLGYDQEGELVFAGRTLTELAEQSGTPVFYYSASRVQDNFSRVLDALKKTGLDHQILYAMKANRFAPLLTYLKMNTSCGVDVCSPEEVRHAISCGFKAGDISYTGTSVSQGDMEELLRYPDLMINCDSLSMMRRLGKLQPGREIGIRINPAMGVGYGSNELLRYSGDKPTKFGIYLSELDEAIATAQEYGLKIIRVHFHTGCGYLNDQLAVWEEILNHCITHFLEKLPGITTVNLGGGLGVPLKGDDMPLDLNAWSNVVQRVFSGKPWKIQVEPGTYVVKDAGVLLLEANTVETKAGHRFVGVNGGFNLAMEPAHYQLPCEPAPCSFAGSKKTCFAEENLTETTVAGNINEALDLWIQGLPMPEIQEDQPLAMVNAGGYTAAMSSNHCMRGCFSEYLLL